MQKRGQLSFFIIIGIVLLIIVATFLALRLSSEEQVLVAPEYQPIEQFVEGCMRDALSEALYLIGANGGHIEVPPDLNNPLLFYETTPVGINRIPFWWYDGRALIPTLEYEHDQILSFMQREVNSCLDFVAFEDVFLIEAQGTPQIEVGLFDESTVASMQYPLTITRKSNGEINTDLKDFEVILPIRFKSVFELATQIMEAQLTQKFVEEKVIDLIALTSEEDIPYTGTEVKCGRRTWSINDIRSRLKRLMQTNIDFIKIKGTDYNEDALVDTVRGLSYKDSYFGTHYVWDIGEISYPHTHVSFQFNDVEDSRFTLRVRPNRGDELVSNADQGTQLLSFLCWNIWHFTYDVQFPVRVSIVDEATPRHDEYRFTFAFQGSIAQNKPVRETLVSRNFETAIYDDVAGYCETDESDSFVKIKAQDSESGEDVSDAELTFICGNVYCDLGATERQDDGSFAWNKRLPFCNSAIIEAEREGYLDGKAFVNTDTSELVHVDLIPMTEITQIEIKKHIMLNQRDENDVLLPPGPAQDIELDEQAFILIRPLNADFDDSYTIYPENPEEFTLAIPAIADQEYEVSITLLKGDLESEPEIIGGYEGIWSVDEFEAQIAEHVVFHVIEFEGSSEEQSLFLSGLKSYSEQIPEPVVIG